MTLTNEGQLLLPHVEDLLLRHDNLKTQLAQAKQVPRGNVRIATIYSVGIYELTPFLKKFIHTYPEIHIDLQYRLTAVIYDLLLENKIDLGIVAYPETRAKIKVTPFGTDHLVLIVPAHHRLAQQQRIRLHQIQGEQFTAFDQGIPTREAIDKVLTQFGIQVQIRMTHENIDTLKEAVEVGLGISIVPSKTVKDEIGRGNLKSIQIDGVKLNRPLGILTLKERVPNLPMQLLIQTLTGNKPEPMP